MYNRMKAYRTYLPMVIIVAFFAMFYSLLSLVPHYNFRTFTYDLGIPNQTLYQYAHGESGPNTLRHVPHLLGDHLEITMFLFVPFYYLFGSYTLLVWQIAAVLFGGAGVYVLTKHHTNDTLLSVGAMTIFFLSFGVISAIIFDFHNNAIGIAFLPWMLWAWHKQKLRWHYLFLVLMILAKETFALIGLFWGISILLF